MSEKTLQNYFMKLLPHGYRTSLVNGGGFPDVLIIREEKHALIELKVLKLGPTGNKMIRGLYKKSQMPWHMQYFNRKGLELYTVFKLSNSYGVIKESKEYVRAVVKGLTYKQMKEEYDYKEYKTLKEVVDVYFS